MAYITISLPKKLITRVEKYYPNINWPDTIRRIIIQKLDELERTKPPTGKPFKKQNCLT
ncbi:MAG: hypothetical protein WCX64_06885 [Candidatus Micrarchaeia archaeon]|jgi:hypothetical protein